MTSDETTTTSNDMLLNDDELEDLRCILISHVEEVDSNSGETVDHLWNTIRSAKKT